MRVTLRPLGNEPAEGFHLNEAAWPEMLIINGNVAEQDMYGAPPPWESAAFLFILPTPPSTCSFTMLPRTHRAMLAAVLPLLVLVILAYVPSAAVANHVTCSWTGPGNDPEPAGWINTCVAKKQSDDGETAIYVGYFEHGHSTVADFGKLRPNKDGRGRLE